MSRPLIAVPSRFSRTTSALRFSAVVTARTLADAVYRAGGEPLLMHPWAPGGDVDAAEIADRLSRCDGVLLPGGGDVAPYRYGAAIVHERVYDVEDEQDAFDLALASHALKTGMPLLAICRGLQVVNTALGGTLCQDMTGPHRHVVQPVEVEPDSLLAAVTGGGTVAVSCFHHQSLDRLGEGLVVTARAPDGTAEAVERPDSPGWFLGVQWHPEDTAATDAANRALFAAFVTATRLRIAGGAG